MSETIKAALQKMRHARWARILLPPLSVLLVGIYPAFYYYTQNVANVLLVDFLRLVPFYLLLTALVYGISLAINRLRTVRAANAAIVFLVFFNTYGLVFDRLREANLVRVEHFTLLPFYIFLGVYSAWLITRLNKANSFSLWRIVAVVFTLLAVYSVIVAVPHEVRKAEGRADHKVPQSEVAPEGELGGPDIYYLVFDEFAGFKSMADYWQNPPSVEFRAWLEQAGFYVVDESMSSDIWSIHQIATRLNYTDYKYAKSLEERYLFSISNNRVMAYLKTRGYTTAVFEQYSWFFPVMPEIQADHVFDIKMFESVVSRIVHNDFAILVMDGTMLYPISHGGEYLQTKYEPLRRFFAYTSAEITNLDEITSPKFVYLHMLMPHQPYLYDAAGQQVDPEFYKNWDYYEGYYEYTITVIKDMLSGILGNADPANPPVIILQSDHGARVKANNRWLDDFPPEFQQDILFAYYLPDFDTSQLTRDIDPINTFPIVFNHYFNADFPLQ